jgi:hypothetical protein
MYGAKNSNFRTSSAAYIHVGVTVARAAHCSAAVRVHISTETGYPALHVKRQKTMVPGTAIQRLFHFQMRWILSVWVLVVTH